MTFLIQMLIAKMPSEPVCNVQYVPSCVQSIEHHRKAISLKQRFLVAYRQVEHVISQPGRPA